MELIKKMIGSRHNVKAENGQSMSIVIEDNPKEFPLYKKLGLDVFVKSKAKKEDK